VVLIGAACSYQNATAGDASGDTGDTASPTIEEDLASMDFGYSDRDCDATYDASSATSIVFAGNGVSLSGEGATVSGSTVTITSGGTYVVSGSSSNGSIVINTDDKKVHVVLDGVTLSCNNAPCIQVQAADKVFVTLADGTTNVLSDGSGFTTSDEDGSPDATIYSKADLAFNGSGALSITATCAHAIHSTDDVIITGGTYDIQSVEDGIRGKDCVKINDASISIAAQKDGIASTNDEDSNRGFVSIDGGTIDITA
jgi:hypothetical protein